MALARLHISRSQFYDLTPKEFYYALKDYEKQEDRRRRFELEKMRLQTIYLVNSRLPQNKQYKDVKALMPFEWEKTKVSEAKILTPQEWAALDKKIAKIRDDVKRKGRLL